MYKSRGENDAGAKVAEEEEDRGRQGPSGATRGEDGEPGAKSGAEEDDENGRDAKRHAAIVFVPDITGVHGEDVRRSQVMCVRGFEKTMDNG